MVEFRCDVIQQRQDRLTAVTIPRHQALAEGFMTNERHIPLVTRFAWLLFVKADNGFLPLTTLERMGLGINVDYHDRLSDAGAMTFDELVVDWISLRDMPFRKTIQVTMRCRLLKKAG